MTLPFLVQELQSSRYSELQSFTSNIYSLPSVGLVPNQQISDIKVLGNTRFNHSGEAGKCDDNTLWNATSFWDGGGTGTKTNEPTIKVSGNNSIKLTKTNDIGDWVLHKGFTLPQSKVFITVKVYIPSTNTPTLVRMITTNFGASDAIVTADLSKINQWQTLKLKLDALADLTGSLTIQIKGVTGCYICVDEVLIQSLSDTEYANDSLDTLNAKYHWITPSIAVSTLPARVKSIGKNIWGSEKAANDIIRVVGKLSDAYKTVVDNRNCFALVGSTGLPGKIFFDKFIPNTQYTISCYCKKNEDSNGGYLLARYTDGTSTLLTPGSTSWTKRTITTQIGKSIKSIETSYDYGGKINYFDYDTLQIEQGTTATTYEPYTSTEIYTPADWVGRSVGSGSTVAKDEYSGDGTKTIRNGSKVLQASDIGSPYTGYTNIDVYRINKPVDSKGYNNSQTGWMTLESYSEIPSYNDSLLSIGKFCTSADAARIEIIVAKGTTLAQVQATLTGTSLNYQLTAEAVEANKKKYPPQTLIGYPNGTLIVSPHVQEFKTYNAGATISNTAIPIKAIESITKINADGSETNIDLATVTINTDKLSFTSTALANNDKIKFVYEYDQSLSTLPTISFKYSMNIKSVVQENTNTLAKHSELIRQLILKSLN